MIARVCLTTADWRSDRESVLLVDAVSSNESLAKCANGDASSEELANMYQQEEKVRNHTQRQMKTFIVSSSSLWIPPSERLSGMTSCEKSRYERVSKPDWA